MSRRILVTGGAGFIGMHLVRALSNDLEDMVTLADDFSRGRNDDDLADLAARANVRAVTLDVTDRDAFAMLDGAFDEIYHLAAVIGVKHVVARPMRVLEVNVGGTLNLLRWLEGGSRGRLLFASTSEVYAWTRRFHTLPVPTPEDVPLALTDLGDPRSTYAASKIAGELAVAQWGAAQQRPFTILRYHNVYGPRMGFDHVIPELYQRAAGGQDPLVVYSPSHRRAFCYVDDAVDGTIAAMRAPRAADATINIGNDAEEIEIAELARRLLRAAALERALEGRSAASDPVDRRCPDLTRARELLAYAPRVGLDEGLARTLAWYAAAFAPSGAV